MPDYVVDLDGLEAYPHQGVNAGFQRIPTTFTPGPPTRLVTDVAEAWARRIDPEIAAGARPRPAASTSTDIAHRPPGACGAGRPRRRRPRAAGVRADRGPPHTGLARGGARGRRPGPRARRAAGVSAAGAALGARRRPRLGRRCPGRPAPAGPRRAHRLRRRGRRVAPRARGPVPRGRPRRVRRAALDGGGRRPLDPGRLVVGGASSGGGAAAGLALLARDRGELPLAGQVLVYPMLDDREVTASSREVLDPRLWNRESNRLGWAAYLSGLDGAEVPRLRRARPRHRRPRTAADLARDRRARPLPRRGHRVCVAPARRRSADRAARLPRRRCTASTSSPRRPPCRGGTAATATRRLTGLSDRPGGTYRPRGNDSATGFREVLASALRSL